MHVETIGRDAPSAPETSGGDTVSLGVLREARRARGRGLLCLLRSCAILVMVRETIEERRGEAERETHEGEPAVRERVGGEVLEEEPAGAEGERLGVVRVHGEPGRCLRMDNGVSVGVHGPGREEG